MVVPSYEARLGLHAYDLDADGHDTVAAGSATLDDLTDVTITTPAAGQLMRFNGTIWVNVVVWREPQFDYTGSAILDGAGNPIMVEVVS